MRGCWGATEVTVMFDNGADRSYLTNDLVNALTPPWIDREPVAFASFGSGKPSKTKLRDIFSVSLQDANGMDHTLLATAVDVICAPLFRPEIPKQTLESFDEISFADRYDCGSVVKVDLLIGLDAYWRFVLPQVVSCDTAGMMAQATVFGWMVSGPVPSCHMGMDHSVSHQL